MAERETSRYIDEKAADWIARLDRGQLSGEESQALEAWLRGDPRRRGALLRADALSMLGESARALGPDFDPQRFAGPAVSAPPAVSRRKVLAWAGVGGLAAASIVALGISLPAAGAITTGLGEVRLVTLDDGSTVMLNTQTRVQVDYGSGERRIELLDGEAYFTIVRDQRPFLVDVGGTRLRGTQATFRVRKLGATPVDILVDRGGVVLARAGMSAPVVMQANTRLVIPPAPARGALPSPQSITPDLLSRELAWRDGKIAFEGERLDQAVTEFARYSNTRIEIRDPALAGEPVTGLFSASDPAGFGRAVAAIFGARVEQRDNAVILSRGTEPR
ncbi:FecR domain-containing protein [Sphingomonas sp. JC676]|nr:FecR domain-containing protein [Sphingomonas sp. JC676]